MNRIKSNALEILVQLQDENITLNSDIIHYTSQLEELTKQMLCSTTTTSSPVSVVPRKPTYIITYRKGL
jgi:hypothetical protein